MENLAEWGYVGLFIASFLAATIIPFSSEVVLSILLAKNYDLSTSLFVASIGNWIGGLSSYLIGRIGSCLLYTSPSPRDYTRSRMPSSA